MINYPELDWESRPKVEGKFLRDFSDFYDNIVGNFAWPWEPKNERLYIAWFYSKALEDLNGDFVECGVFAGETSFFMAKNCKTNLHLFDSWEGVTDFTEHDNEFYRENPFRTDIESAQKTMAQFENVIFHHGPVPHEFDTVSQISFLHIDLDNYSPTKLTLEQMWDKVVEGGVVMVDFHDSFASGAEKATRDFFDGLRDITVLATGKAVIVK